MVLWKKRGKLRSCFLETRNRTWIYKWWKNSAHAGTRVQTVHARSKRCTRYSRCTRYARHMRYSLNIETWRWESTAILHEGSNKKTYANHHWCQGLASPTGLWGLGENYKRMSIRTYVRGPNRNTSLDRNHLRMIQRLGQEWKLVTRKRAESKEVLSGLPRKTSIHNNGGKGGAHE